MNLISRLLPAAAFGALLCGQVVSRSIPLRGDGYFPVLVQLKDNSLLAVLRGGGPHVGKGGRLDLIHSRDAGKSWSKPRLLVDGPEDDRNPALGQLRDGTVIAAFAILSGYGADGKLARERSKRIFEGVYVTQSKDGGKTWSKPELSRPIHQFYWGQGAVSPYGKIVQLSDGTVLMAVYFEFHDQRGNESYIFRSRDSGRTWGEPTLIGKHYNETGILALPGDRVLAALRSEKGGSVSIASSPDGGKTWSDPVQVTENSEHPADLIRLRDGRVLMTFGDRLAPRGVRAVFSKDEGKTWDTAGTVQLADDSPNSDCGYPSSVETRRGTIVTLYYQVDDLNKAPESASARSVIWKAP
ncbi:MAG: exo-alpha-sialidase [Acidobacteria bacterium]|nr:exo-alpha-sialidase [Acidobacteriota bacterium]